jgi:hypothetical protein
VKASPTSERVSLGWGRPSGGEWLGSIGAPSIQAWNHPLLQAVSAREGFESRGLRSYALRGGGCGVAPFLAPMRCVRFCSLAFAVDRRKHLAPLTCKDEPKRTTLDGRYFIAKVGVAGSNLVVRSPSSAQRKPVLTWPSMLSSR